MAHQAPDAERPNPAPAHQLHRAKEAGSLSRGFGRRLGVSFFARPALEVAADLLGRILIHRLPEGLVAGRIVEAEAYSTDDPGCHAFRGLTPRNEPMFGPPGRAYVYFTYGMHHMLNAVTDTPGVPGAVLIRAVEPLAGLEHMRARRGGVRNRDLARGPGRLTQAFGIGAAHNRIALTAPPLYITAGVPLAGEEIAATPRIGLGDTQDGRLWRLVERGSSWASSGPMGPRPPRRR